MRLFFEVPGVRLFHGDCREAPSVVGEQRFSLTLADPPYEQTSLAWDRWPDGWLSTVQQLRAENGSMWCWGALRLFMARAGEFSSASWRLAQDVIWEKHNGSQPAVDKFLRVHEQVTHFYPVASRWRDIYRDPQKVTAPREARHKRGRVVRAGGDRVAHGGAIGAATYVDTGMRMQRSVWPVRSTHRQGTGHATGKPLGVLEPLVRYSCPPGGWVLVSFVGSGAEVEAAVRNGRNVIGFETSEAALENAVRRLGQQALVL